MYDEKIKTKSLADIDDCCNRGKNSLDVKKQIINRKLSQQASKLLLAAPVPLFKRLLSSNKYT